MRSLNLAAQAALAGSVVRIVQLVLMSFPGAAIALNTSNFDLVYSGVTYRGAASLGSVGAIESAASEVKGLAFEISGVSAESIALAFDDAGVVQGTPVVVRTAILDENLQVVDAPVEWSGRLDTMTIQEDGETCAIAVTAESSQVDLLRGNPLTYSNADQQMLFPGDRAFEYVVSQASVPVVWPAKEWLRALGPR